MRTKTRLGIPLLTSAEGIQGTVSYTHLDVYKRQVLDLESHQRICWIVGLLKIQMLNFHVCWLALIIIIMVQVLWILVYRKLLSCVCLL